MTQLKEKDKLIDNLIPKIGKTTNNNISIQNNFNV
jgi:hypothetical protein